MANVLLSEDFLNDVYRLVVFLDERINDPAMEAVRKRLENEINEKLEAKKRRQMFTDYKVATRGTTERETARQKYLDDAGIHKDWRTATDLNPPENYMCTNVDKYSHLFKTVGGF